MISNNKIMYVSSPQAAIIFIIICRILLLFLFVVFQPNMSLFVVWLEYTLFISFKGKVDFWDRLAQVLQDMCSVEHILDKDPSLVKSLNHRLEALTKISMKTLFQTGKNIPNRNCMSKLIHLIPLWSGCELYFIFG